MNTSDRFDPATLKIVALVARDLQRHPAFRDDDAEDIEMDLVVHLLERQSAFDSEQGDWTGFVRARLRQKCANMIHLRTHKQRSIPEQRIVSLDKPVESGPDDQPLTLGDMLENEGGDSAKNVALALDVAHCMEKLPPKVREAAELLRDHPPAQVAVILGIGRMVLLRHYLPAIRAAFRELL